jgi:hypothetical protein
LLAGSALHNRRGWRPSISASSCWWVPSLSPSPYIFNFKLAPKPQTSVLGQLLPIKLGAYESALMRKINALRKTETRALARFLYLISVASTLSNIGSSASFLVTLMAYVAMRAKGWGDLPPLDVSRIFT